MVLSGAEYSMTVMTAFLLSFVAILSRGPFSINVDILGFFQNCSYTILALSFKRGSGMPRTESSSTMSQGYLDFYYMSSAISLLSSGLGSQCKSGPRPQIVRPHSNVTQTFLKKTPLPNAFFFFCQNHSFQCLNIENCYLELHNKQAQRSRYSIPIIYREDKFFFLHKYILN